MRARPTLSRWARILPVLAIAACDSAPTGAEGAPEVRATLEAAPAQNVADVRREIEANNARLIQTFVAGDAAAAAAMFAEDAVLLLPGMPMVSGRAQIEQTLAGAFAVVRYVEIVAEIHEVQVFGNYALEMGTTRMTYEIAGQRHVDDGKYLVGWTREPGGTWKIHRDASNVTGPAR